MSNLGKVKSPTLSIIDHVSLETLVLEQISKQQISAADARADGMGQKPSQRGVANIANHLPRENQTY
jgi:hypothetical protein